MRALASRISKNRASPAVARRGLPDAEESMQRFPQDDRIDIDALAQSLQRTFGSRAPVGRGLGRERLKAVIMLLQGCSPAVAEQVVEVLVLRGQLAFHEEVNGPGRWRFGRAPARC